MFCNISIAKCTEKTNTYILSKIGKEALGSFGKYLVDYGIAISQICFPCSYVNLTATVINMLIQQWFELEGDYYWYIAVGQVVIFIPLCFIRKIKYFGQVHLIGDIAVLATVIALLYNSIIQIKDNTSFDFSSFPLINSGWAKVVGMAVTMLEGVGVILPIKESMENKKDFNSIIIVGMTVVIVVLSGFPIFAYFSYGDNTHEIILTNLPFDKIYIQVVMLLLVFSIIVVFPVQLYPAFQILERFIIKCNYGKTLYENILRTTIVLGIIIIGIFSINRFADLMSLAGCAVCMPIALIFPSIFHFQLYKEEQGTFRNVVDILICIIGLGLSCTILTFTILDWGS